MIESKKMVLVGPAGVGKTSICKSYFDMGNPKTLLDVSLQPTRGINSNMYSLFNSQFGVFDLAGQENEIWLSSNQNVFDNSNLIICIFDVMNSLESIISFLIKILQIKKRLGLSECKIITFIHKIDLVEPSYVFHKIKAISDFFKSRYRRGQEIEIYKTSIAEEFFFSTFSIIGESLNLLFKQEEWSQIGENELANIKNEINLLRKMKKGVYYDEKILYRDFDFKLDDFRSHIDRLLQINFVQSNEALNSFKLTERSYFFKFGLEKEFLNALNNDFEGNFESYYIFLSLNKVIA